MRLKDVWKFAGVSEYGMRWYECVNDKISFKDGAGHHFKYDEVLLIDSEVGTNFYGIVPKKDITTACINLWRKLEETT